MKRLISLFAVLLFMTGMVMAQTNNVSKIHKGPGHRNDIKVFQDGDNTSEVAIRQIANNNKSNDNVITIHQTGTNRIQGFTPGDSEFTVKGDKNDVSMKQNGTNNKIMGDITGNENNSDFSDIDKNALKCDQTEKVLADFWDIYASRQYATVYQRGVDNKARLSINGDGNSTAQYQRKWTSAHNNDKNFAEIDITGNDNDVMQFQNNKSFGRGHESLVEISGNDNLVATGQIGKNHHSEISITSGVWTEANNEIGVYQTGANQWSEVNFNIGIDNNACVKQK